MGRPTIHLPAVRMTLDTKRQINATVGALPDDGWWEVKISPRKGTRTLLQNAWYWAGIVTPFAEFLRAQDYEDTDLEFVGGILRGKFLAVSLFNKNTGELIGRRVRSTTELTTEQMADYCERCRAWLLDMFGIITIDPNEWKAKKNTAMRRKSA